MQFDHEKLEVYQASIRFVSFVLRLAPKLTGQYTSIRDQLIRVSQSIPLNIAEGNGKRSFGDRRRFFEIARGSTMESAACMDVLCAGEAFSENDVKEGKELLYRIASMLSRLTEYRPDQVREEAGDYRNDYDNEHEHDGEHVRFE